MYKLIRKDQLKRKNYLKIEIKKKLLLFIIKKTNLNWNIRVKAQKMLNNVCININRSKIRNVCVLTGRSRSVYKHFKISRNQIKKFVHKIHLCGVNKACF